MNPLLPFTSNLAPALAAPSAPAVADPAGSSSSFSSFLTLAAAGSEMSEPMAGDALFALPLHGEMLPSGIGLPPQAGTGKFLPSADAEAGTADDLSTFELSGEVTALTIPASIAMPEPAQSHGVARSGNTEGARSSGNPVFTLQAQVTPQPTNAGSHQEAAKLATGQRHPAVTVVVDAAPSDRPVAGPSSHAEPAEPRPAVSEMSVLTAARGEQRSGGKGGAELPAASFTPSPSAPQHAEATPFSSAHPTLATTHAPANATPAQPAMQELSAIIDCK